MSTYRPYNDSGFTAAQSLAIVASVLSAPPTGFFCYFFWGVLPMILALVVNGTVLVMILVPCCHRVGSCFLRWAGIVDILLGIAMIGLSIFLGYLSIFLVGLFGILVGVAMFAGGVCWIVAGSMTFCFVNSGRHSELEREHNDAAEPLSLVHAQVVEVVEPDQPEETA